MRQCSAGSNQRSWLGDVWVLGNAAVTENPVQDPWLPHRAIVTYPALPPCVTSRHPPSRNTPPRPCNNSCDNTLHVKRTCLPRNHQMLMAPGCFQGKPVRFTQVNKDTLFPDNDELVLHPVLHYPIGPTPTSLAVCSLVPDVSVLHNLPAPSHSTPSPPPHLTTHILLQVDT